MPLLQRIKETINFELTRYSTKTYGRLLAIFTFTFYFTTYPDILGKIWPSIQSYIPDDINLFVATVLFLNISLNIIYNVVMYFIYMGKYQFFEQFRISTDPWPWESNHQQWRALLRKTCKYMFLNVFIFGIPLLYVDCLMDFRVQMKGQQAPSSKWVYVYQFIFFLILQNIWNYLMHAIFHMYPFMYQFHKIHHQYKIPFSLMGQYTHPFEYIISNSISTAIGFKILINFTHVHIFSIIIWLTFRIIQTCDSHAGYNWPWIQSALIPGNSGDDYHFYHHKINVGNYSGIMYFMDSIFGTNKSFWDYQQEQRKIKHKKNDFHSKST